MSAHIREVLCDDPTIEFVVAFGSRIDGTPRQSSDLDIAVKFGEELSGDERFKKRYQLSGRLQRASKPFVDISDIDELSISFAHAVANGDFVCGDEDAFESFKTRTIDAFAEQRTDDEDTQQEFIRRIAEDGLHG